jgi:hypothetical protein
LRYRFNLPAALLVSLLLVLPVVGCGGGASFGIVEYGEFVYSGTVDGDYLVRQLIQLDPPFQACYVRAKRGARDTEGVIELSLTGGSGRLSGEITSNTTGSTELGECVLGAIAGLTIIEPEETAPWDYTANWSVSFELTSLNRTGN